MHTVPVPKINVNQQTREKLGEAIYLFLHIIHRCNWETGALSTTIETITNETGFPDRTVRRWLEALASSGLIIAKRTRTGSLFTIADYEAIAHTRRINKKLTKSTPSNRPQVTGQTAKSDGSNRPAVTGHAAKSDRSQRPQVTVEPAKSGLSNIRNQILSQNNIQNIVQNKSLNSIIHEGKGADKTNPAVFTRTDIWDQRLEELQEKLNAMADDEMEALFKQALTAMSRDIRPFVRMFVIADETGALQASGASGTTMMLRQVWEILQNNSAG